MELDLIKKEIMNENYALSPLYLKLVPVEKFPFNKHKFLSHPGIVLTVSSDGQFLNAPAQEIFWYWYR